MVRLALLAGISAAMAAAAPCYDRAGLEGFEKRAIKVGTSELLLCFQLPFGGSERPAIIFAPETGRSWEPKVPPALVRRGLVVVVVLPQERGPDPVAAIAWIRRNSLDLGVDPRKIAWVRAAVPGPPSEPADLPALALDGTQGSLDQIDRFLAGLKWVTGK